MMERLESADEERTMPVLFRDVGCEDVPLSFVGGLLIGNVAIELRLTVQPGSETELARIGTPPSVPPLNL